jgi:UDP-glucose 4-epimerase
VLVTGASGFIGAPLSAALVEAGHQVRAAVRDRRRRSLPSAVEIALLPDLAGGVEWAPLVAGRDAVVHLAAIAHVGPEIPNAIYDRVNHLATAALAKAAAAANVRRFVFMSSTRAQAGATSTAPLTENATPHPTDAYGRSKLAAEVAVRASGVPYTILRPALVYGPNPKGNVASLMRLAAKPIPLPFGAFSNRRSLLALDNLIGARSRTRAP